MTQTAQQGFRLQRQAYMAALGRFFGKQGIGVALLRMVAWLMVAWVLLGWLQWAVLWAVMRAEFHPNLPSCLALQAQTHSGACWGVIAEKWHVLLLGRYPPEAAPQGWVGLGLLLAAWGLVILGLRRWALGAGLKALLLLGLALLALLAAFWVLSGYGVSNAGFWLEFAPWLKLQPVPSRLWGGLPLTLALTLLGFALACPMGLLLALGRHQGSPLVRKLCGIYIEIIRSIPLVAVLFIAAFVLPKWWPTDVSLLVRVLGMMSLFVAAYVAEVIRGGLQGVPSQQAQAAKALGLSPSASLAYVVLPQALRYAASGLANVFVGVFKECSLVAVVGLFEFTGSIGLALNGDVFWRAFFIEAYVFAALVYIVFGFTASKAIPKHYTHLN